jgi:hypothetical protein
LNDAGTAIRYVIEIRVTAPNMIGRVVRCTMRAKKLPAKGVTALTG